MIRKTASQFTLEKRGITCRYYIPRIFYLPDKKEEQLTAHSYHVSSHANAKNSFSFKSKIPGHGNQSTFKKIAEAVKKAVLPRQDVKSVTRVYDSSLKPKLSTESAVTLTNEENSDWKKKIMALQSKLEANPFYKQMQNLKDNEVFNKGVDVAERIRERWETSNSPLVHKIQDFKDSLSHENEYAQALREIRARDPKFDMVEFVRLIKFDIPVIVRAYLEGDLETLKKHCKANFLERVEAQITAYKAQNIQTDSTVLDLGEVQIADLKFVENNPVIVLAFTCQQIRCLRDNFNNVVEGHPTDVQRVYYYWALQQDEAGFVGEDDEFHSPQWQLMEIMIRGMHHLL